MSEQLHKMHGEMMDRYFDEGWSAAAVATEYGRTSALVTKLVKMEEGSGRVRLKTGGSPDPRRRENRKALSRMHALIGVRVARHRARSQESMTDFGIETGLSRFRVGEVESGSYDLSLLEIQAIATKLDMTIIELITEKSHAAAA